MEFVGRIATALGISLILTLLLLLLYQDDGLQGVPSAMTQAAPVVTTEAAALAGIETR